MRKVAPFIDITAVPNGITPANRARRKKPAAQDDH
jgi:hypothetical protein